MPRGVYDRSKNKEQRAAEKAESAVKTSKVEKTGKRKYTKRADKAVEVEAKSAAPVRAQANTLAGQVDRGNFHDINTFTTLVSALPAFKDTALYSKTLAKIEALLERIEPAPVVEEKEPVKAEKMEALPAPSIQVPTLTPAMPIPVPVPVAFNGSNPA